MNVSTFFCQQLIYIDDKAKALADLNKINLIQLIIQAISKKRIDVEGVSSDDTSTSSSNITDSSSGTQHTLTLEIAKFLSKNSKLIGCLCALLFKKPDSWPGELLDYGIEQSKQYPLLKKWSSDKMKIYSDLVDIVALLETQKLNLDPTLISEHKRYSLTPKTDSPKSSSFRDENTTQPSGFSILSPFKKVSSSRNLKANTSYSPKLSKRYSMEIDIREWQSYRERSPFLSDEFKRAKSKELESPSSADDQSREHTIHHHTGKKPISVFSSLKFSKLQLSELKQHLPRIDILDDMMDEKYYEAVITKLISTENLNQALHYADKGLPQGAPDFLLTLYADHCKNKAQIYEIIMRIRDKKSAYFMVSRYLTNWNLEIST